MTTHELLNLNREERAVLAELLESERAKLLIEIRHTIIVPSVTSSATGWL